MGKKKKQIIPDERLLGLPSHPQFTPKATPIVDTHTHLLSTYAKYRNLYPGGMYEDVFAFVRGLYGPSPGGSTTEQKHSIQAIIDVWCEAPVTKSWKDLADSALTEDRRREIWSSIDYWFVMGVHPHEAKFYTDEVERDILVAMEHPRCVGWGEIGLDYHYENSPRDTQQAVLSRQLRHAVKLGKPITIHTREAEADTERILKAEVPVDHRIHIHCFTDSPEFALRLMSHFPNLYVGITGVITYSTNLNTSALLRSLVASSPGKLRILLETDAPYMTPSNIYRDTAAGGKLPLCHTAMVPWTAEFVAQVINEARAKSTPPWDVERVMHEARENAKNVYGI